MSDTRLRELERSAAAGDLEAHGQLLREQVRSGQITEERLELLGYLFWPPAWKALGWTPQGHSGAPSESFRARLFKREGQSQHRYDLYQVYTRFERWAHGLRRWRSAALRVGAAAARFRWTSWEKQHDALADTGWDMPCPKERILALLDLIDLHISSPRHPGAEGFVLEHEGRALLVAGPIAQAFKALSMTEDVRLEPTTFAGVAIFAGAGGHKWLAQALKESCDTDPVADAQPCTACGQLWPAHRDGHRDHEFEAANDEGAWCRHVARREEAVYQAIRNELVPWATGGADPVKARIERAGS